ncbi:MAG TPA: hypothetical protein VMT27_07140 [Actinomycetes bacterium]|nr:hypothetical protein [Actinomycetes bacterium]
MHLDVDDPDLRPRYATYDSVLAFFEQQIVRRINADHAGEETARVYAELVDHLQGRLPGLELDERRLRTIAHAISTRTFSDRL